MRKSLISLFVMAVVAGAVANPLYRELYVRYANAGAQWWADPNTYGGLWEFEATNSTQTLDTSGNSYHATIQPDVATGPVRTIVGTNRYSRVEHGYLFDGSNDALNMGDVLDMRTNSMTAGAWIKNTSTATMTIITKNKSVDARQRWSVLQVAGKLRGFFDGTSGIFVDSPNSINDGNWNHVCVVYNRTGNMTLYVNSIAVTNASISAQSAVDMNSDWAFMIGANRDAADTGNVNFYNGLIDYGFVVMSALSTSEILELYQNTHPTNNVRIR